MTAGKNGKRSKEKITLTKQGRNPSNAFFSGYELFIDFAAAKVAGGGG